MSTLAPKGDLFSHGIDAKKVAGSTEPDGQPWLGSCLLKVIHPLLATVLSSAKGNYINNSFFLTDKDIDRIEKNLFGLMLTSVGMTYT